MLTAQFEQTPTSIHRDDTITSSITSTDAQRSKNGTSHTIAEYPDVAEYANAWAAKWVNDRQSEQACLESARIPSV
jgi:hypothetical protein